MRSKKILDDYNPGQIEPYWQKAWQESGIYESDKLAVKKPFYNLMMFPYPSAEGLHVGNMYAFCGSDIYGRFKRMQDYDVFEPIGLDGFGIHSENFALKIGQHPKDVIRRTEANFYRQLHATGNAFDWSHKLETYDLNYYKWTQWIFIQLFKNGLAYRAKASVNWCLSCKTVLADEQVIRKSEVGSRKSDKSEIWVCERCGTKVEKKELSQWFFKITAYAQRLLDGLKKIDWSEKVKIAQRNWIGRSDGVLIKFSSDIERDSFIEVFTTRSDTIYGATFLALAPEHPSVPLIINKTKGLLRQNIRQYVDYSKNKSFEERQIKSKTGIKTDFHGVNPLSGKKIPIYVADYVLPSYGTGAIMGVPAHDQRDFEFAKEHGIDIIQVISGGDISKGVYTGEGILINSNRFNGLNSDIGIQRITQYIKDKHSGTTSVTWHLRDWIISRQRYWGPPIPMIFCKSCQKNGKSWFTTDEAKNLGMEISNFKFQISNENSKLKIKNSAQWAAGWNPVPEEDLPVELPYIKDFKPTGTGVSPLAQDVNFVKVACPECGGEARRETDVSDTFLDSAWYFLRYPSVGLEQMSPVTQNAWGPISSFPPTFAKASAGMPASSAALPLEAKRSGVGSPSTAVIPRIPWDPEITKRWLPVDMYIGGAEHSVLHLLYSRFLTMVFYDLGLVDFEEPFSKFRAHGLLISKGAKMSKSRGNIVTPDAYIEKYGADTLRCYLMFCGRFTQGGDFRDTGIEGMSRFLKRVWRLVKSTKSFKSTKGTTSFKKALDTRGTFDTRDTLTGEAVHMMHKTIKRVTADIESLDYNTAISAIMEWVNFLEGKVVDSSQFTVHSKTDKAVNREPITRNEVKTLLLLLAPFAPHVTEELWQRLHARGPVSSFPPASARSKPSRPSLPSQPTELRAVGSPSRTTTPCFESIHLHPWPKYDPKLAESEIIVLVVQVNGKLRDRIEAERGIDQKEAEKLALSSAKVTKYLQDKKLKKTIFVPDRLINFVI